VANAVTGSDAGKSGQRISLVLGSGGARGLAHIGVIRCLREHGYEIAYIAGSSIGALIGGIYAAGHLETYASWVSELRKRDVVRLLDWSFSRGAIFSGERIISVLRDMVGDRDIETLDIGFTAVATEINEGREIWLNRGPLFAAIRASIAMPLIFAPVERGELLLVDGGLINPVPIAPTLNSDTAITIAVDLNGPPERLGPAQEESADDDSAGSANLRERLTNFIDDMIPHKGDDKSGPPGAVDLALRSIDTMQTTIARMKLAVYSPELTVRMPANLCTFLEFHRGTELIEFGYRRTEEALKRAGFVAD
jgi:NTE family protein